MSNRIHGHEVLQMIGMSNKNYTKETLLADIKENFGEDTRFFTCSTQDMTPDELVDFFIARGKLDNGSEDFNPNHTHNCSH